MSQRSCFTYGSKSMHYFKSIFCLEWQNFKRESVCLPLLLLFMCWEKCSFVNIELGRNKLGYEWECLRRCVAESSTLTRKIMMKSNRKTWNQTMCCSKYRYMCFFILLLCSVNLTQWTPICSLIHIHHLASTKSCVAVLPLSLTFS